MKEDSTKVYVESIHPDVLLSNTQAYEVLRTHGEAVSRLGWVNLTAGEERSWVALAIVSPTGDSFLGVRPTAAEAIELVVATE